MSSRKGSTTSTNKGSNRKDNPSSELSTGARPKVKKDRCGSCNLIVMDTDSAVECEVCNFWFHCTCQNVSDKLYQIIHDEADTIHWYCRTCNASAGNMLKIMTQLQSQQAGLQADISDLKNGLLRHEGECKDVQQSLNKKMDELKNEFTQSGNVMRSSKVLEELEKVEKSVESRLEDIEERERRKSNLIIYGLPESDEVNPLQRKDDDTQKARSAISQSFGEESLSILATYRLGRKSEGKTRPLKVVLKSADVRDEILRRYRAAVSAESLPDSSIQLSRDRTQREREEYRRLRNELKLREDKGEENLMIRRGKIVQRRFREEHNQNRKPESEIDQQ